MVHAKPVDAGETPPAPSAGHGHDSAAAESAPAEEAPAEEVQEEEQPGEEEKKIISKKKGFKIFSDCLFIYFMNFLFSRRINCSRARRLFIFCTISHTEERKVFHYLPKRSNSRTNNVHLI